MRYRLQRHDGTDCSATMVPITVLRMVPIQRYRQKKANKHHKEQLKVANKSFYVAMLAVVVSTIVPFGVNKCTDPVELNRKQIESLQKAIKESKVSFPDSAKLILLYHSRK